MDAHRHPDPTFIAIGVPAQSTAVLDYFPATDEAGPASVPLPEWTELLVVLLILFWWVPQLLLSLLGVSR